ncbi:MAG: hypothetical protein ACQESR_29595 [Planctomycetota bacterium]
MPRACPVVVHVRRYKLSETLLLAVGSVERNGPRDKPVALASDKALFQGVQPKCEPPRISVYCP